MKNNLINIQKNSGAYLFMDKLYIKNYNADIPINVDENLTRGKKVNKLIIKGLKVFIKNIDLESVKYIEFDTRNFFDSGVCIQHINLPNLTTICINHDNEHIDNINLKLFDNCPNVKEIYINYNTFNKKGKIKIKIPKSYTFNNIKINENRPRIYYSDEFEVVTELIHFQNFEDSKYIRFRKLTSIKDNFIYNNILTIPSIYQECDIVSTQNNNFNKIVLHKNLYKFKILPEFLENVEVLEYSPDTNLIIPYNEQGYKINKIITNNIPIVKIPDGYKIYEIDQIKNENIINFRSDVDNKNIKFINQNGYSDLIKEFMFSEDDGYNIEIPKSDENMNIFLDYNKNEIITLDFSNYNNDKLKTKIYSSKNGLSLDIILPTINENEKISNILDINFIDYYNRLVKYKFNKLYIVDNKINCLSDINKFELNLQTDTILRILRLNNNYVVMCSNSKIIIITDSLEKIELKNKYLSFTNEKDYSIISDYIDKNIKKHNKEKKTVKYNDNYLEKVRDIMNNNSLSKEQKLEIINEFMSVFKSYIDDVLDEVTKAFNCCLNNNDEKDNKDIKPKSLKKK